MACPYANFRFMGAEERDDSTVEQALAGGTRQRVGWWCFYFADEHWEWSPRSSKSTAMRPVLPEIRGPRKCFPHKHPEEHIAATLDDIRQTHKPFSTRHRIITVRGDIRDVVVTGERFHDDDGDVIGTQGFYIDVTPTAQQRGPALLRPSPRSQNTGRPSSKPKPC